MISLLTDGNSLYKDKIDEETKKEYLRNYQMKSRDNARTPMQWDDSPQAGFTTSSKPWMRVHDNYTTVNAASQVDDPTSVYHCWRQVLEKRKALKDVFVYGNFDLVDQPNEKVFAYKRVADDGQIALVVCNFTDAEVKWSAGQAVKDVIISTSGHSLEDVKGGDFTLAPCSAVAVLL
jgi:glycosidase